MSDQPPHSDSPHPEQPPSAEAHYPYPSQYHPAFSRHDQQQYASYVYPNPYANAYVDQYGNPYPSAYVNPYGYAPPPPQKSSPGTGRSLLIGLGAALAATALVLGGVALTSGSGSSDSALNGSGTLQLPTDPGNGSGSLPGFGPAGGSGSGSGSSGSSGSSGRSGTASAAHQVGVVTIVSTLKYQNAQSAGTGMILSSDGEVLTNNHVIRNATSVVVTVETTGRSYKATVVGTAPGSDVAMLKMQNASGLSTAKFADDADDVKVDDAVTGVGNAGGTGTLTSVSGKVTALDKTITASDEGGADAEKLSGLIEINAKIIAGDSGGPLYDADGDIIGMDTAAASTNSQPDSTTSQAYAIPIDSAMSVVKRIESGVQTTDIHIGYPGFLGVSTENSNGQGAAVAGLLDGGPAADAGITAGSVITSVDGKNVTSADSLRTYLTALGPGTSVKVDWTDASGQSHSATVTLAVGPAD